MCVTTLRSLVNCLELTVAIGGGEVSWNGVSQTKFPQMFNTE